MQILYLVYPISRLSFLSFIACIILHNLFKISCVCQTELIDVTVSVSKIVVVCFVVLYTCRWSGKVVVDKVDFFIHVHHLELFTISCSKLKDAI